MTLLLSLGGCFQTAKLLAQGDSKALRERDGQPARSTDGASSLLVIAIDGVGRDRLYERIDKGKMPRLSALLGATPKGAFPHAYFSPRYLSTLPSTTMAAWATALTGVGPGEHGMTGNEYFIRERRQMAAPVPVSFSNASVAISNYTDGYANRLLERPTVYERMRRQDEDVLIWVAMHPLYEGADRLLTVDRTVIAGAFESFLADTLESVVSDETSMSLYEELDEEVVESVEEELEESEAVPDVLTVYLVGLDAYTHVSSQGPDRAQEQYLTEVIDPLMGRLHDVLKARNAFANRYVVVTADHGHTEVAHDEIHALNTDEETDPPALLRKAGFRVRPFELEVDEGDYQAVLAYQGAIAYVYLADRSTCLREGDECDWSVPPRFEEDVLPAAEAFFRNNETGELVPELKDTLELILTRRPKKPEDTDEPFLKYTGGGRLEPIRTAADYPFLQARFRSLSAGRFGERAGDLLLLAHNGNRKTPKSRYYFSHVYHSWHGSPSRRDSEIPLIVSHPSRSTRELERTVDDSLGEQPFQERLTPLLLRLRYGHEAPSRTQRSR